MRRQEALTILAAHQNALQEFGIQSLMIFGSIARDEAKINSDVDLLVEFAHPVGLFTFLQLKRYLENILNCSVDLGTPNSVKANLREKISQDLIHAF